MVGGVLMLLLYASTLPNASAIWLLGAPVGLFGATAAWLFLRMTPWGGRLLARRAVRAAEREIRQLDGGEGPLVVRGASRTWPVTVVAADALSPPTLRVSVDLGPQFPVGIAADSQESLTGGIVRGVRVGDEALDAEVRLWGTQAEWLALGASAVRAGLRELVVHRGGDLKRGRLSAEVARHRVVLGRSQQERGVDLIATELVELAEALTAQWRLGPAAIVERVQTDPCPGVVVTAVQVLDEDPALRPLLAPVAGELLAYPQEDVADRAALLAGEAGLERLLAATDRAVAMHRRVRIAERLAELPEGGARVEIAGALLAGEPAVATIAAGGIQELGDPGLQAPVEAALRRNPPGAAPLLARWLGRHGDRSALRLIDRLGGRDPGPLLAAELKRAAAQLRHRHGEGDGGLSIVGGGELSPADGAEAGRLSAVPEAPWEGPGGSGSA